MREGGRKYCYKKYRRVYNSSKSIEKLEVIIITRIIIIRGVEGGFIYY